MRQDRPSSWVVYRANLFGAAAGRNAVCTRPEWDAMELARPGHHVLIRADVGNEGEAERLARDLQTPPVSAKPARPRPPRPSAAVATAAGLPDLVTAPAEVVAGVA